MAFLGRTGSGGLVLTGERQLSRKLMRLQPAVQKKIGKDALVKAARPIIRATKANIGGSRLSKKRRAELKALGFPRDFTGNLRRSIGYRLRRYGKRLIIVLGPRRPKGAHGHLVEYGTAPRYTDGGEFRGKMPALPFMRPAWDTNLPTAQAIMRSIVQAGILREAAK